MNVANQMKRLFLLAALAVAALGAAGAAQADGQPIAIEPDGAAPAAPAPSDDDDPPIPPYAAGEPFTLYVSAPGNGTVAGIAYADEDVLAYNTATGQWAKVFDGTNAGLPASADVDALDYRNVNLHAQFYLSFDKPAAVPGLGTVDDSDVVLRSCFLGRCSWAMVFDGSAHGLTATAEDVDALDYDGAVLRLSTSGGYRVPKYGGGELRGGDEDVMAFLGAFNTYIMVIDGSAKGLAGGNDVRAFDYARHYTPDLDWFFLGLAEPFTYQYGSDAFAAGAPNDIFVDERPTGANGTPPRAGTIWDASAAGFPTMDAIALITRKEEEKPQISQI